MWDQLKRTGPDTVSMKNNKIEDIGVGMKRAGFIFINVFIYFAHSYIVVSSSIQSHHSDATAIGPYLHERLLLFLSMLTCT